jgi:Lipase (class 3)
MKTKTMARFPLAVTVVFVVVTAATTLCCSIILVATAGSSSSFHDEDMSLSRSLQQELEANSNNLIGNGLVWMWNVISSFLFLFRPDCYCALPYEYDLCRADGVEDICRSVAQSDADAAPSLTKRLFLKGCQLLAGFQYKLNCDRDEHVPYRPGVESCYDGDNGGGIRVLAAPRGACLAGTCCDDSSLCEMEKIMYFISLGYGVNTVNDDTCDNAIVHTYGAAADCQLLTDGTLTNEALVCTNLDTTDNNYCHVSFAGTNDIIDLIRELSQAPNPLNVRYVDFGNGITIRAAKQIVDIALGQPENNSDGIVEIVYQNLQNRGCLSPSTKSGVHLLGHSLGGLMASLLTLKLGAQNPTVPVRVTTAGEPGILLEPLAGAAAALPAWRNKVRYISGTVLPRSNSWRYIGWRPYGYYQSYDIIPQLGPDMHYIEATGVATQYFACESIQDGRFVYQLRGADEGCADGRSDVLNPLPEFPHPGGLQRNTIVATIVRFFVDNVFVVEGTPRRLIDMFTFALDLEMVENFMQVLENHAIIRYVLFFNKLTQNGSQCNAVGPVSVGGVVGTC